MKKLFVARPRNPLAAQPLMRKGGAHTKTRKAQRRADKVNINKEMF